MTSSIVAVEVKKNIGSIRDNLDAVEASVKEAVAEYNRMVVTGDSIADIKQLLADIRKKQNALDDGRKTIKKEWMKPYEDFEKRAKKIISLYNEPIEVINEQLAVYEEERRAVKREAIAGIYADVDKGKYADWLPLDLIFDERWLNTTYSSKNIRSDIEDAFARLNISILGIEAMESEFEQDGLDVLRKTGDFQRAVQEMTSRKKMKEEIIAREQAKAEAYAKTKDEAKIQKENRMPHVFPNIPPMEEDASASVEKELEIVVHVNEKDLNILTSVLSFNNFRFEVVK